MNLIPTTPAELNAAVVEALGWESTTYEDKVAWEIGDNEVILKEYTPNFHEDLNACLQYVWPRFKKEYFKEAQQGKCDYARALQFQSFYILNSDNPATCLCQEFLKMKEGA